MQNDNVALNLDENPNGATLSAASDGSVSGQLGSFIPFQSSDTASSYSARIDWGDGNASFATLTPGADGTFAVNGSNNYADSGVYAVRVLVTHLSDGKTFALNTTVAVDSGSNPGSSHPGPVNPGQTGSGQGNGASGARSHTARKRKRSTRSPRRNPSISPIPGIGTQPSRIRFRARRKPAHSHQKPR